MLSGLIHLDVKIKAMLKNLTIKKLYMALGIILLVLLIIAVTMWIISRVEVNRGALNFSETNCKKVNAQKVFDPNMYLKDIESYRIGRITKVDLVRLIASLSNLTEEEVNAIIKEEVDRLSNKAGWEQMSPRKVAELTGWSVDWDSVDFSNQDWFCQRPSFLRIYR